MLLLAHRGARKFAPENTFTAFEICLQQGCDGFEFDVRQTADAKPIIWHDPRIARKLIQSATFQDIVEAHARPRRFVPKKHKGAVLCCLNELLETYASRAFLDIEIKTAGFEQQVVYLLRSLRTPPRGLVVSSFLPTVLTRLHRLAPELPLGYIANRRGKLAMWKRLPIEYIKPHWRLATKRAIRNYHQAGKKVIVWTVNTANGMRRYAEYGADGIISDNTELMCRLFHNAATKLHV
ncbi:MAG TPA: glycerophosphodiester phosphodiesterase [Candidatus Acidoferrales bacterium]|nr:glycerophosphodiester phosphodiesterase [Candidatus Acidoferrales bacterium]